MERFTTLAVLLVAIAVTSLGCGLASHGAYYGIALQEVERPADASERYGEQKLTRADGDTVKYYFEDEMVRVLWLPSTDELSFVLENKTSHSIKIIWDEAAYVDVNGGSHRIMHTGVKYTDRDDPQPPTVVVRGGSVSDLVFPTDYVYWKSGSYGGWERLPLLVDKGTNAVQLNTSAQEYVGKNIQVLLPLKIEDVINEYIFTFDIESAEVRPLY